MKNNKEVSVDDFFSLGSSYLDKGRYQELITLYDSLLEERQLNNIQKALVFYEKGVAHAFLNRVEMAKNLYEKSYELLNDSEENINVVDLKAVNQYNFFLLSDEEDKKFIYANEALKNFTKLHEQYSATESTHMVFSYIADIYFQLGNYDIAEYYYELALSDNNIKVSQKIGIYLGLADICKINNQNTKARNYYKTALTICDSSQLRSQVNFEIGLLYYDSENYEKAHLYFKKALEHYQGNETELQVNLKIEILWYMGDTIYKYNCNHELVDVLTNLLSIIDSSHHYYANIHLTLGHYYIFIKKHDMAKYHYDKVLLAPLVTQEELKMAKEFIYS